MVQEDAPTNRALRQAPRIPITASHRIVMLGPVGKPALAGEAVVHDV